MIIEPKILTLEGKDVEAKVIEYEESDRVLLRKAYDAWLDLCESTKAIESRLINIPDGLSEGAFCFFFKCWRTCYPIPGVSHTSFDAYDPSNGERIQIKACSINPDFTSFGPMSVWDKLYLLDFSKSTDGSFDVYLIPNDEIRNAQITKTKKFFEIQDEGKRPRFSIMEKIKNIKHLGTYKL